MVNDNGCSFITDNMLPHPPSNKDFHRSVYKKIVNLRGSQNPVHDVSDN